MKHYIKNLKEKSHAEKSSFAFFASIIITGIIATAWFLIVFASPNLYFEKSTEEQNLANAGSLFDVFRQGIK